MSLSGIPDRLTLQAGTRHPNGKTGAAMQRPNPFGKFNRIQRPDGGCTERTRVSVQLCRRASVRVASELAAKIVACGAGALSSRAPSGRPASMEASMEISDDGAIEDVLEAAWQLQRSAG
jgi:hypothetical protein